MPSDPRDPTHTAYEPLPIGEGDPIPQLPSGFPYERVVALLAGPLASLIGLVTTAVVHQDISKNAAVNVATFAVSAAVTYAAHHKWLSNVPKWWSHIAEYGELLPPSDSGDTAATESEIDAHDPLLATLEDHGRPDGEELIHRSRNG